jgi:acyl-CoA thioesterase I
MISRHGLYGGAALMLQALTACSDERNVSPAPVEAQGSSQSAAVDPDAPIIVAFGDSLYAGYQLPQSEGLAPELQRVLAARGLNVTVVNAGVSGDTTAAARARLEFVLDGLPKKPELVMIGLGGNDLLRGLPVEQTRANLDAMLTLLDERGIQAMLTGMRAPLNLGREYVSAFDDLYPALAEQHSAELHPFLLDGVITDPNLMLDDGLHPNAAGVDRIARAIAPTVMTALTGSDAVP